ncbi:hypothetical protein RHMOL_Rhmol08G0114400 [Rhododendron molle]|uniref:Uncharacterized protein n=1 Tax=Rhododendron molle TaxID=49168 RepID=A0ACC0MNB9_RHOML|nr:hypothetical protein RHMOL_Rhmol08G0114400 [Rhododendron molle]
MSSSTRGSSQNQNYIKYKNRTCYCGKRAAVKISGSEKNPGRLYYRCEDEVEQGGCHAWDWCNPINIPTQLQVPASQVPESAYASNENPNALAGRVGTTVEKLEMRATIPNFITVVSLVFSGIALLMAMAAIMKA